MAGEAILEVLQRAVFGARWFSHGFGRPRWLPGATVAQMGSSSLGSLGASFAVQADVAARAADLPSKLTRRSASIGAPRTSGFYKALVAMTGHDLRHPLQVIVSVNSLLSRRLAGGAECEYLARSRDASLQLGKQLDKLVEALKLHERTEEIAPHPVSLHELFVSVKHENIGIAEKEKVRLHIVDSHGVVLSDSYLLEGMLRNLVRNAIKYNRPGGKVLIGCRKMGGAFRIEVHDNGIGISNENLVKIFDAFKRLDPNASPGLGLGLFIVRHAADSLGHKLSVSSTRGEGSCFAIEVPAA